MAAGNPVRTKMKKNGSAQLPLGSSQIPTMAARDSKASAQRMSSSECRFMPLG